MSIYKTNRNRGELIFYSAESIVTLIIGAVYEIFSHEVYSPFMYLMFMIPLLLGVLPNLAAKLINKSFLTSKEGKLAYRMGVLTLIFGSFLKGVFDIYGTSSVYTKFYLPVGSVMIIAALVLELYVKRMTKNEDDERCF